MSTESTSSTPKTPSGSSGKTKKTFQDMELERMLVKDESVILQAVLHNAIYWKSIAVLLISILFFVFIATPLGILLFVVGVIMLILAIITKHYLLLAITNKRVLARYGLLQMDVVDIRFSKIESIDLERMLPGHIFGYASVVVMGTGQRYMRIPYIANAEAFRRYHNEITLADEGVDEEDIDDLHDNAIGKEPARTREKPTKSKKAK